MKRFFLFFVFVSLLLIVSCQPEKPVTPTKHVDMSGVRFDDLVVEYDGEEHSIEVKGVVPEEVTVEYINNRMTDAGSIEATAKFKVKDGYAPIESMKAILTIKKTKPNFEIKFHNDTYEYDGSEHEIKIDESVLPDGYKVIYKDNKGLNVGLYHASATVYDKNHEIELFATLNIDSRKVHRIDSYDAMVKELSDFKGRTAESDLYVLVNDIDCSITTKENPWKSIGSYAGLKPENGFQSEFDGQGYTINNLYITEKSDTLVAAGYSTPGFFAGLANAKIHDLVFSNAKIDVNAPSDIDVAVGLICGQSPTCTDIYNITINGLEINALAKKMHIGAIVGFDQQYQEAADVKEGVVFLRDNLVVNDLNLMAGLLGDSTNTQRASCGGIVGEIYNRGPMTYSNCYVNGAMTVKKQETNGSVYIGSIAGLGKDGATSVVVDACKSSLKLETDSRNNSFVKEWVSLTKNDSKLSVGGDSVFCGTIIIPE